MQNRDKNFWDDHAKKWLESGLTQIEYSKKHKISQSSLSKQINKRKNLTEEKSGFIEIPISFNNFNTSIILTAYNDFKIEIKEDFNPIILDKLLDLLKEKSCS